MNPTHTACKYVARTEPRVIPGRHVEDCAGPPCPGCQPCSKPHCRICARAHAEGTCAECMAETREALHDIARMCDALPEEVESRGVEGEAMFLLGPACDPEARGHLEASVMAGRVSADYLMEADGELHPLFVLGSWDAVWRDALEHDEPTERLTVSTAVDYLDRTMGYMSDYEHVPFEDFAKDLRRCRVHMEAVLHDGEQIDRGAPCLDCKVPLERVYGISLDGDGWRCPRCHRVSTDVQYRFAMKAEYIANAEWLTDDDCVVRVALQDDAPKKFSAATIRAWASKGKVEKRRHSERTEYRVLDVLRHAIPQRVA